MYSKPRPWFVFVSSSGETFENIYSQLDSKFQSALVGVFCDRPCQAVERFSEHPDLGPKLKVFKKEDFEPTVAKIFSDYRSKFPNEFPLVFLCGFFGILSASFLEELGAPIINTHPSLLPAFPGLDKRVHQSAFEKCSVSGFTLHLVNESLDGGPILFQHPVWLDSNKDAEASRDAVRSEEQFYVAKVLPQLLLSEIEARDRNKSSLDLRKKYNLNLLSFRPLEKIELGAGE